ncbi:hypothetical protein IW262DRAFT_1369726 [Armillaria fumosa]|nr:hypothetical protein IW262DRAFT_1369726 [Armillaria fumosa]
MVRLIYMWTTVDLIALATSQTQNPGGAHFECNRVNFVAPESLALEMNHSVHDGTDVTAQCGMRTLAVQRIFMTVCKHAGTSHLESY